jgi:hypothetical protein
MVGGGKDLVVAGMEEETGDLGGRGWPGIDRIDIRGRIGGGGVNTLIIVEGCHLRRGELIQLKKNWIRVTTEPGRVRGSQRIEWIVIHTVTRKRIR